ncbi:MAG: flagellar hook-basal body protein [Vampirovibrionales bacterium]|nr:flagellar hook-basal body protein [Vampirovibrionales bacterium]
MLKGIYTIASSLMAQEIATDVMANNVANMNTTGFKRSMVSFRAFPELMIERMAVNNQSGSTTSQKVGAIATGAQLHATQFDFKQGDLLSTGNAYHVAIQGDGFFTLKDPVTGEIGYTRNGAFDRDAEGYLATLSGQRVQGLNGDIVIPPSAFIEVMPSGGIRINTQSVDSFAIAQFDNNNLLEMKGNAIFQKTPGINEKPIDPQNRGFSIHQGTLERANVNPVTELIHSMTAMRLYESMQKNIHTHNETLGQAINQMARPN